jgi:hypothetical protein
MFALAAPAGPLFASLSIPAPLLPLLKGAVLRPPVAGAAAVAWALILTAHRRR